MIISNCGIVAPLMKMMSFKMASKTGQNEGDGGGEALTNYQVIIQN